MHTGAGASLGSTERLCYVVLNKKRQQMMGVVVVTSYMTQGMVNNPQIFTTPGLFLVMGAMNSLRRKTKES